MSFVASGGGGGGGADQFPNFPQQGGNGNPRTGGGGRGGGRGRGRGRGRRGPRGPKRSLVVMVDVPEHRRGRVVGARGATIKRIERDSGAKLQLPRRDDPNGSLRLAGADAASVFRAAAAVAAAAGAGPLAARCRLDGAEVSATLEAVDLERHALFEGDGGFACRAVPNPGGVLPADVVATVLDNRAFAAGDGAAVAALADGDRVWVFGWGAGVAGARDVADDLLALPELAAAIAGAIAAAPNGDAPPPPPPADDAAVGAAVAPPPPVDDAPSPPVDT